MLDTGAGIEPETGRFFDSPALLLESAGRYG
jgi:hypothetical protein